MKVPNRNWLPDDFLVTLLIIIALGFLIGTVENCHASGIDTLRQMFAPPPAVEKPRPVKMRKRKLTYRYSKFRHGEDLAIRVSTYPRPSSRKVETFDCISPYGTALQDCATSDAAWRGFWR